MKKILLATLLCLFALTSWAEDIIVTKDAKSIKAIVTEVSKTQVKYKDPTNPDGPLFILETSDIQTIVYANGTVQNFNVQQEPAPQESSFPVIDFKQFHGFLLQKGNCVYISTDSKVEYEHAAQVRFKEIISQMNIWTVVDRPEQAHFIILISTIIEATPDISSLIIMNQLITNPLQFIALTERSDETSATNIRNAEKFAFTISQCAAKGGFDNFKSFKKQSVLTCTAKDAWNIP